MDLQRRRAHGFAEEEGWIWRRRAHGFAPEEGTRPEEMV
jgi:hypothetical protein